MSAPRPRVLIVDDDPSVGHILADVLQPTFDARAVTDPEAALEIVRGSDVAIVLADQQMPRMSGHVVTYYRSYTLGVRA